ncbi:MAG: DUF177 domain-containing protein [Bacteroidales bacterium]|nr:DUF177 domain-containing protein [Bacteroidales bacterium]
METRQIHDKFKIRIAGIAAGSFTFSMDCDKAFFEVSGLSILHDGVIHVRIKMEKMEKMLNFAFQFEGKATANCDRCLEPVTLKIDFNTTLIVTLVNNKNGKHKANENDDIWFIDENSYELDFFHYIYESLLLALPQKIVHPDDENGNSACNPEMLEKLTQCSPSHNQEIDPRWETLKKLKLK